MQRTAKQERAEAILGELTELGLLLARDLVEHARSCEDGEEKAALTAAFHKTTRMVRLNLALDAKLDRDAARDAREAARFEAEAVAGEEARERQARAAEVYGFDRPQTPAQSRKTRVSSLLARLVWNECEGDSEEFEILKDDLTARLDEAARSPEFEDLPIEFICRRMIADMGLSGELTLTLREPPPDAEPAQIPEPADSG